MVRAFRHVDLDLVGTTGVMLIRGSDVVATVMGWGGWTPAGAI
jgi:hypothetical protein